MTISLKQKTIELLHKLGRFIKTDIAYLLRGNLWLGLGTIIGATSSFLVALAFGNFATPDIYGTYRFVLSFYSILAIAGLGGFGSATVRAVAKGFEGDVIKSLKIQAVGSLIGSFASALIATYYFVNQNQLLGVSFLILAFALPFIESIVIYDALLIGRKKFKASTLYLIAAQVVATVILITGIYFKLEVIGLLVTFFASWIIIRFIFLLYVFKKYHPNNKTSSETFKLGAHLTVMGVLNNIANYLDKIVIFHYMGATEVAIYSFAIAPGEQLKGLFKNISALALPRFSKRNEQELKKTMLRKMLIMGLVISTLIFIYIIFAPLLFKIFLPKYHSSIFPSQLFMLSLIGVIAILPIAAMKSLSKIKNLYFFNTISPIINIVLIVGLTSMYGLYGTVVARLLGRIIGIFLSIIALYWFD